ncbi:hypothetical protein MAR_019729 [Mya arenaria]|uniref:Claudin n=1 Tax=Mya arenaria TaxID=6604 RepID=A0ABY7E5Z3_MYAAR|nr:uncharacterized protein LOC128233470 [Mya arenaria]WAR04360.1 hypothetical protein MAR_019729 [Mya arenaria]
MNWLLIISFLLTLGSAVLNALAVCLPYWLYMERPSMAYQGLWQKCMPNLYSGSGTDLKCEIILLPPEFLDATRVMMLLGLCFYVFSTICSFLFTCTRRDSASLLTAATILVFIGALLTMVGVVTYGAMYPRLLHAKGLSLHAAFGIGVCSCISGFVNVLFYCMVRAKGDMD